MIVNFFVRRAAFKIMKILEESEKKVERGFVK
jgi:hypothetical protein